MSMNPNTTLEPLLENLTEIYKLLDSGLAGAAALQLKALLKHLEVVVFSNRNRTHS